MHFGGVEAINPATIVLENEVLRIEFAVETGDILRAALLKYKAGVFNSSEAIRVVDPVLSPGALSLHSSNENLERFLSHGYSVHSDQYSVNFVKRDMDFEIEKKYQLSGARSYFVDATVLLRGVGAHNATSKTTNYIVIPLGGKGLETERDNPLKSWEFVYSQNEKVHRQSISDIKKETLIQGTTDWIAFGNRYLVSTILNKGAINPDIVTGSFDGTQGGYLRFPLVESGTKKEDRLDLRYFLGPKDIEVLSEEPALRALIDHGMFSVFAKPILFILRFFFRYVNNYGVAIILLTLLVRAIFYPLSLKSYRSMKAMQKLQPQIQALREKLKDDREQFNREQLALFKTHGVNPAGGCLPMLVQLPVYIALYAVLGNSIELFQAPFFGWITDLSAKDPYYVYPVLMGFSMLLQQWMTPTPGMDPMQVKMMYIMPVVFTFIMINLPSGLTLYIFLSTLLGILQQWAMNRQKSNQPSLKPVLSQATKRS
jgi:YidC/Oxa1 family membrane protein insertase